MRNAIFAGSFDTIKLGANVSLTGGDLLAPSIPITIDTQTFTLTDLSFADLNGQTVTLSGTFAGDNQPGLLITGGSTPSSVTNNGTINGATGSPDHVISSGAVLNTTTFVNNGSVNGGGNPVTTGAGIVAQSAVELINNGSITGGGVGPITGGGAGVELGTVAGPASTLTNNGTIQGGDGLPGGVGVVMGISAGLITNNSTGIIEGRGNSAAIEVKTAGTIINDGTISGAVNTIVTASTASLTLELRSNSTISGNVIASATLPTDVLRLGGTVDDTFDLSQIGGQYQNFDIFRKTGTGTWSLTGTSATDWDIQEGTLQLGDGTTDGSIGDVTVAARAVLAFNPNNLLAYNGTISGDGAVEQNGGETDLSGVNSYTGGTTINSGLVVVETTGALGTGPVTINSGLSPTLLFDTGVSAGDLDITNSGTLSFNSSATAANATIQNAGVMRFLGDATAGNAQITNAGGQITFLDLSSAGTATIVNQSGGSLIFSGDAGFSPGDQARIENDTGASIQVSGSSDIGIGSLSGAGDVLLSTNRRLTLGGLGLDDTIDGIISGTGGSLTKTGTGTLTLAGVNTYTGGTAIDGGTLSISSDDNLGSASGGLSLDGGTLNSSADMVSGRDVSLVSNGTLSTDIGTTLTLTGTLTGSGGLIKSGDGILRLDGTGDYAGGTTVNAGILSVNGDYSATTGTITVADGGTLKGIGILGGDLTLGADGIIAPGNSIGTQTIAGNYTGNGGTLEIEAELGDDVSPADKLVITGNTAGTTNVKVINLGGTGARTVEGIKIVDVGGTSAGTFNLQGDYVFEGDQAVVAGAYAYRLYKNGVSTPLDGDWYLRSVLIPSASTPLFQAGAPVYEAYPQLLLSLNALPTYRQRVGNRSWSSNGAAAPGTAPEGAWLRTESMHGSVEPDSTTDTSYDYDLWKLQAGVEGELYKNDNGLLIGGLTAHYGTVSGDINSTYGDGDIDTTGYGVGATLTWYGNNGFYVDAQSEATWYDSDLKSDSAGTLEDGNNGFGYAMSLETGKSFALVDAWSITPQAQFAYSSVDFDSFTDPFDARVSGDDGDSLAGRIGVALDRQQSWQGADGRTVSAAFYGATNLYYEFLDGTTVDLSGVALESENDRLSAGITLGGSYSWNDERFSVYGEVVARSSLKDFGDSYAISGTAGIRVKW